MFIPLIGHFPEQYEYRSTTCPAHFSVHKSKLSLNFYEIQQDKNLFALKKNE